MSVNRIGAELVSGVERIGAFMSARAGRRTRAGWAVPLALATLLCAVASAQAAVNPGDPVGEVAAPDEGGQRRSVQDLRGKVVVLVFWGSECPSSKRYAQRLAALSRKWGDKVAFLGVASNGYEDAGKVKAAKQAQGLPFPVLIDAGGKIAHRLGVGTTPIALVVDAQGVVRYRGQIDDDPRGDKGDQAQAWLRDAVQAVLDGRAPPQAKSPTEQGSLIKS